MVTVADAGIRLSVRVQPRAARDRVVGVRGEAVKVQVSAPPVDGAANDAVVAALAAWLGVGRRSVRIVHGMTGRDKVVEVASEDPAGLAGRVRSLLEECVDKPRDRN